MAERPLTRGQSWLAVSTMLAVLPSGFTVRHTWCNVVEEDVVDDEEITTSALDARQRALAESAGYAAAAEGLASHYVLSNPEHLALAELYLSKAVKLQRSAGGAARGSSQTRAAKAWWRPWIEHFQQLVVAGLSTREARHATLQAMVSAGAVLPSTGELPDDRTLRTRLTG